MVKVVPQEMTLKYCVIGHLFLRLLALLLHVITLNTTGEKNKKLEYLSK